MPAIRAPFGNDTLTGMRQYAAISSDFDTLKSIYKGRGCRRPGGYSHTEFRMGVENFCRFFERFRIKTTVFMVGHDFAVPENVPFIRALAEEGHEIGNHTLTHAQGFRMLSTAAKEAEIAGMEDLCEHVTGRRPVGFRSPGWNLGDDAVPILKRRGYLYDSSVHPTVLMPVLKALHWWTAPTRVDAGDTTMGHLRYMLAPVLPYRTAVDGAGRRGADGLIEFPLTVVPLLRLPFWATVLVAGGLKFFELCYGLLKRLGRPIQYQFHLSDFVDYEHAALRDEVPWGDDVYVPQAFKMPLAKRLDLYERAVAMMAADYEFTTLECWARRLPAAVA